MQKELTRLSPPRQAANVVQFAGTRRPPRPEYKEWLDEWLKTATLQQKLALAGEFAKAIEAMERTAQVIPFNGEGL